MARDEKTLGEEIARLVEKISEALQSVDGKRLAEEINAFLENASKLGREKGLGPVDGKKLADEINRALEKGSEIRESVAAALARAVEELLKHTDSAVRAAAAPIVGNPSILRSVVAERWLAQLIPPALDLLSDADEKVRAAAAAAFENIARWTGAIPFMDDSAVERVKKAAESVDATVRHVAETILGKLEATQRSPAAYAPEKPSRAPKAKAKKPAKKKPAKKKPAKKPAKKKARAKK